MNQRIARLLALVLVCTVLAACEGLSVNTPEPTTITIAGASSMRPVLGALTKAFSASTRMCSLMCAAAAARWARSRCAHARWTWQQARSCPRAMMEATLPATDCCATHWTGWRGRHRSPHEPRGRALADSAARLVYGRCARLAPAGWRRRRGAPRQPRGRRGQPRNLRGACHGRRGRLSHGGRHAHQRRRGGLRRGHAPVHWLRLTRRRAQPA